MTHFDRHGEKDKLKMYHKLLEVLPGVISWVNGGNRQLVELLSGVVLGDVPTSSDELVHRLRRCAAQVSSLDDTVGRTILDAVGQTEKRVRVYRKKK